MCSKIGVQKRRRKKELSMENTEWEMGLPPKYVEMDMFVCGHVRRAWRRGDTIVLVDCTHPAQNMIADVERVEAWRARSPIKVIEFQPYGSNYMAFAQPSAGLTAILGGIFG